MTEPSTRVQLRVVPGGRSDMVVGRYGDAWKVRVTAPPDRGAANRAVIRLIAGKLAVPERSVQLVSGHGARDKILEIRGIAPLEVEGRLGAGDRKDAAR